MPRNIKFPWLAKRVLPKQVCNAIQYKSYLTRLTCNGSTFVGSTNLILHLCGVVVMANPDRLLYHHTYILSMCFLNTRDMSRIISGRVCVLSNASKRHAFEFRLHTVESLCLGMVGSCCVFVGDKQFRLKYEVLEIVLWSFRDPKHLFGIFVVPEIRLCI